MPADSKYEVYRTARELTRITGLNDDELNILAGTHSVLRETDGTWPVFKLFCALVQDRKTRGTRRTLNLGQLEEIKKKEEIRKLQLSNMERAGTLIKRKYAKERVRLVFQNVTSKIRYAIKNTAPRLVGVENARLIEELLIKSYNGAITLLEEQAECLDWEKDTTGMDELCDTQPDTQYAYKEPPVTLEEVKTPSLGDLELNDIDFTKDASDEISR